MPAGILLLSLQLRPCHGEPHKSPTPAPRGHFVCFYFTLFCFNLSLIFALMWTSRVGSELCSVAGIQDGLGRGSDPQGAA